MSFSQVVIYSKSYCPYCDKTKSLFQSQFPASNAKVYELDQMNDGSEIQNALAEITGQRTVPNVWVKGKFIGGNDDVHSVLRSGKLKEMLS
jgi:glutaredoxin 3